MAIRRTATMRPVSKGLKKGLKKVNPRIPSDTPDPGAAPENTGGGLPFFNPYGSSKPPKPKVPKAPKPPKSSKIPKSAGVNGF